MVNISQYKSLLTPASLFTISFLSVGLFLLGVLAVYVTVGTLPSLWFVLAAVVLINIVVWLVSPFINELVMRFVYDIEWMSFGEFETRFGERAERVDAICREYELAQPKIGLVKDSTPFAMTFGSDHWNARIVFSEGLSEYLDASEFDAVMAHEVGHIRHRDFILMTIINTLLQCIFVVYLYCRVLARRANDRAQAIIAAVAILAYVFYRVSYYIQLYVSRTREYKADAFAAQQTSSAALSSALVKISYGLLQEGTQEDEALDHEESHETDELESAEKRKRYKEQIVGPMNIMAIDSDENKSIGEFLQRGQKERAQYAMLYDAHSPWSRIVELQSTHPLTGNRIQALEDQGGETIFDLKQFAHTRQDGIRTMKSTFYDDLKALSVKYVGVVVGIGYTVGLYLQGGFDLSSLLLGVGLTVLLYGAGSFVEYRRRFPSGDPNTTQVGDLYREFAASPVHGIPVSLEGQFLGRYPAGNRFTPDLTLRDRTGFVPTVFFSRIGIFGRLWKAVRNTKQHVDNDASVTGWYYRSGSNNRIHQRKVDSTAGSWTSYPKFFFGLKLVLLGLVGLALIGAALAFDLSTPLRVA